MFPRGINGGTIFRDQFDHKYLLALIANIACRHHVSVHAFALMSTHYHLIVTPPAEGALAKAMQAIGIRYTRYFNRKYGRIGTIWNERYGATLLADERYWYTCLRYVDLNPFRAHVVRAPEDSPWSSYRVHAFGETNDWLTPHPLYLRLGPTPQIRQAAYRKICRIPLTDDDLELQRHPRVAAEIQLPPGA